MVFTVHGIVPPSCCMYFLRLCPQKYTQPSCGTNPIHCKNHDTTSTCTLHIHVYIHVHVHVQTYLHIWNLYFGLLLFRNTCSFCCSTKTHTCTCTCSCIGVQRHPQEVQYPCTRTTVLHIYYVYNSDVLYIVIAH